jgi:hypothetical protein
VASTMLSSGRENFTSSTLWNWCWRMSPRVSLPGGPGLRPEARGEGAVAQGFRASQHLARHVRDGSSVEIPKPLGELRRGRHPDLRGGRPASLFLSSARDTA